MNTYGITVETLSLSYCQKKIFDKLSIHIPGQSCTAILGMSGVGKSTFLRSIAGLMTDCNHIIKKIKPNSSNTLISYMPQKPVLLPWLNVANNILISKKCGKQACSSTDRLKALELLEQVQLANTEHLYPHQLSGGMYQRTALARALFEDKPIILMDEPFSSADAITRFQLQDLACRLLKNKTVLLVTHDPLEALRMADRIHILSGSPATLSEPMLLSTAKPRDISNPDLLAKQAELLNQLRINHD